MATKQRLRELGSLAAQFVPLEIDTGSPAYGTWEQKFPSGGGPIPIIYIVRADGEKLYAKAGGLEKDALAQLLTQSLAQAGKALSEQEAKKLDKAVTEATAAHQAGDVAKAVSLMSPYAELKSYAVVGVQASQLVARLTEEGALAVEAANEKIDGDSDQIGGAVELVRILRVYKKLPEVFKAANDAKKRHSKAPALKEVFTQALVLDKAAQFVEQKKTDKALVQYRLAETRYADTAAAQYAADRIAELEGGTAVAQADGAEDRAAAPDTAPAAAADASGAPAPAPVADGPNARRARGFLNLAKAFAKTNTQKARQYAEQVIELVPNTDLARQAEIILAEAR